MSDEKYEVKTIASLERLKLSVNGNPRFRVTFTDGTVAQTQTDASVGYSIENSEYRDVPLKVFTTRAGRIWNLEPAGRRVTSSEEAPMTGAQWATHHVTVWLENDRPLAEYAQKIARNQAADGHLAAWVADILYGTANRRGADPQAIANVIDSFTREDFELINWREVRDSLLAE